MDCFKLNFKLKYKHSDNIKANCVNAVIFNLHQIKQSSLLGHPVHVNQCRIFRDLLVFYFPDNSLTSNHSLCFCPIYIYSHRDDDSSSRLEFNDIRLLNLRTFQYHAFLF